MNMSLLPQIQSAHFTQTDLHGTEMIRAPFAPSSSSSSREQDPQVLRRIVIDDDKFDGEKLANQIHYAIRRQRTSEKQQSVSGESAAEKV
jgi:hypothetical protein